MFVPNGRFDFMLQGLTRDLLLFIFSGQGLDREDTDCWYSESTSAASSVDSSEYNSDDGFIDIESEDAKISSFSVSISIYTCIIKLKGRGHYRPILTFSLCQYRSVMPSELIWTFAKFKCPECTRLHLRVLKLSKFSGGPP